MDTETLPVLVEHPIRHRQGSLHLSVPGRSPIALVNDQGPIRTFNPGWQATGLFTLLDPLWVLVLQHEQDGLAWWYVASDGSMARPPRDHPAADRELLGRRLRQVAFWLEATADAAIGLPVPAAVLATLDLPEPIRRELDVLLDRPLPPDTTRLRERLSTEAPPLAVEPIAGTRSYRVGHPGAMVPMVAGDALAELQPGWEVSSLQAPFAPMLTVNLRHADGAEAAWFIDLDGRLLSHHIGLLAPALARHLVSVVTPLFEAMWHGVVLGEAAMAEIAGDGPVHGLIGDMPFRDLAELLPIYLDREGASPLTRIWSLDEPPPPGLGYVVPTACGPRVFEQAAITKTVAHALHGEMEQLLRSGRMTWPSPLDGTPVESDGFALLLEHDCFAYRFRQHAVGLVFHVVCTGTHFYNYAVYFPTADLLVAPSRGLAEECRPFAAQARANLLRHLIVHRDQLAEGSRIPRDPVVQQFFGDCRVHIGHYVWQDLAGLTFLCRALADLPATRLPQLQIFDCAHAQSFFGPEERIFPRLAGRVVRHDGPFRDHVGTFYRRNQRVIKYTAISVPADLRGLVQVAVADTPELEPVRRTADAARDGSGALVLIGIRTGNRTMEDMGAFAAALIEELARRFPGCTIVLDGMNDAADRGMAVWPQTEPGSILDQEFAIARDLETRAAGLGVRLVSTINRSALHSVAWCARADCFIAPLGAALAKYRWLCNTPGLVLTSRWNLQHRTDLHIYDAPAALEGSSEMLFNSPEAVRDVTAEADAGSVDGRGNFVVKRAPVFEQFVELVRRSRAARPRRLPSEAASPARDRPVPDFGTSVPNPDAPQPAEPVGRRLGLWRRAGRVG